jgi:hypothetical protein
VDFQRGEQMMRLRGVFRKYARELTS